MDFDKIVQSQRDYYATGVTRPYAFRRAMLEKLRGGVKLWEPKIAEALRQDLGKSETESYMCETGMVLEEIGYILRRLRGWMREKRVPTPLSQFRARCFLSPEPYGTVLIMAPWNYPIQLCLLPLAGAIAAGNTVVLKPSAYAPASSRLLLKLLGELYPPEYVKVVEGGRVENSGLLKQKFDHIFFTGSPAVGHVVMEAAAKNLTPVTLELGGKSPVILDETADLSVAARRIACGKTLNAGQTCVEPDYLLIHESRKEAFIEAFRQALAGFFPDGDHSQMCHIVDARHYAEKKELLRCGKAAVGGETDDEHLYIAPTLLTDVDPEDPVMQEEIFAPILPLLTWKTLDEAIDFIRARPRPLALYVFTKRRETWRRVLDACSFGGGCINDTVMHVAVPGMAFGGVGNSGMGCYHGRHSFDTFTHVRSIVKKAEFPDLTMRYMPYTEKKLALVRRFLK